MPDRPASVRFKHSGVRHRPTDASSQKCAREGQGEHESSDHKAGSIEHEGCAESSSLAQPSEPPSHSLSHSLSQHPLSIDLGQHLCLTNPSPGAAPAVALQNAILSCMLTSYRPVGQVFYTLENQFGCQGVVIVGRVAGAEALQEISNKFSTIGEPFAHGVPGSRDAELREGKTLSGPPATVSPPLFQTCVSVRSADFLKEALESRSTFPQNLSSPLEACLGHNDLRPFPESCRFTPSQLERFRRLWNGKLYALDCEMVKTQKRSAQLGSVCLFDQNRVKVFSSYCRPDEDDPLVDCLTRYSGLTKAQISGATLTARDIGISMFGMLLERDMGQMAGRLCNRDTEMIYLRLSGEFSESPPLNERFSWEDRDPPVPVQENSNQNKSLTQLSHETSIDLLLNSCEHGSVRFPILVGHAIQNDLAALRFGWPLILDTSKLYSPLNGKIRLKLKSLAETLLGRHIQTGKGGHNAGEDALATLDLCTLYFRVYGIELNSYGQTIPPILLDHRRPFCLGAELARLSTAGQERTSAWHLRISSPAGGATASPCSPSPSSGRSLAPELVSPDAGSYPGSRPRCTPSPLSASCAASFSEIDVTGMDNDTIRRSLESCFPKSAVHVRPLIVWSGGAIGAPPSGQNELTEVIRLVDAACPQETLCLVLLQGVDSCLVLSHVVGQGASPGIRAEGTRA